MGKWAIVQPYAGTNLISNPCFEVATTGWAAVNTATLARTLAYTRRQVYSLSVTPSSSTGDGAYFGTVALTTGNTYTFSVDVLGAAGVPYQIYFANTSGTLQGTAATFTGTGAWQRVSVSWACNSTTSFRLYVCKNNSASTAVFYVDGALCHLGASACMYFDGDTPGNVAGRADFYWTGTRGLSTSVATGQSANIGVEIDLETAGYFASISQVSGAGLPPRVNLIVDNAVLDGAQFQGNRNDRRGLTLVGVIDGKGSLSSLHACRQNIISLLDPAITPAQPLTLRYTGAGGTEYLQVLYRGGMDGGTADGYSEIVSLKLEAVAPLAYGDGWNAASLATSASIASTNYLLKRSIGGSWSVPAGGASGGAIKALAIGPDGTLYAGGAFTSMNGVASTAYVAKLTPGASNWSSLGGSGMNNQVLCLAVDANGVLYAGGLFTVAGGAGSTAYVAKNAAGSAWSSLGGSGMTAQVNSLLVGPTDGAVYAVGEFASAGGAASTAYIAKNTSGSAWSSIGGSGAASGIQTIAIDKAGSIYVGGIFTTIGAASTAYVAKNINGTWSSLGGSGMDNYVETLTIGPDGILYAGGRFTYAGGVAANRVARYNGTAWKALGAGFNNWVYNLVPGAGGEIYSSGIFTTADGITLIGGYAVWNGTGWYPLDTSAANSSYYCGLLVDTRTNSGVYVVHNAAGSTLNSALTTITNDGTTTAYPTVVFTGPGSLTQLKNYTTGDAIYFNNLYVQSGETVTLTTQPDRVSLLSSARGSLISYILPGSDLAAFRLLRGANAISLLYQGASAAAVMRWQRTHLGLDGASA